MIFDVCFAFVNLLIARPRVILAMILGILRILRIPVLVVVLVAVVHVYPDTWLTDAVMYKREVMTVIEGTAW